MSSNPAQNATPLAGALVSPKGGRYLPIGEAANFLGVSIGILRKFEETGKIVPLKTLSGERRYSLSDLEKVRNEEASDESPEEKTARGGATGGSPVERPQVSPRTSDGTRERQDPEPAESPQTLSSVLKEFEVEPQEKPEATKPKRAEQIRDYRAEGINPYQATGLLSVEQVATKMGVSSRTIRRLIAKGKLRPATTGKYGSILIPAAHVDGLVNGFQKPSDSPIALPALAPSTEAAQVSARKLFFLNAAFVVIWLTVLGSSAFLSYALAPEGVKEGVKGKIAAVLFGEGMVSPTPTLIEQTKQALITDYLRAKDGNKVDYKVFFFEGATFGNDDNTTIDSTGKLTTSEPITITDTSTSSLEIGGGMIAGTGNVYIIDRSGRIPALTSTYIADLDATSLTGKIDNADHLDAIDSSSFLRSNESDTAEGAINFTAAPGSVNVGGGPVYVNPGAATANYTLLGVAVNASQRFKVDAEGDTSIAGTLGAEGATTLSSTLAVTGATTLSSTLAVTGNTTLTGDLAVNGGDLTTSTTTFNLVNATATTVNFAGAATTLSIGASSGTTTINNALAVTGASTFTGNLTVDGRPTFTKVPTSAHTGTWVTGVSTWNQSDATIYINPASAAADTNLLGVAVGGSVKFDVDAEGDIYGRNLILEGTTTTGTTTITGSLSVEGNTTLGDAVGDTLTVNPATFTWAGGNKTLDITGAATRTLTLLNSTASQVANLDLSDGSLQIASTTALDNSRNATLGSVTATGLMQTTLTTEQLRLRYDASNYTSFTVGSTGAVTLDATGAGAAFTISDALTVTGATTFNGAVTANTDVDLTLLETENFGITNTVSGTNALDLVAITLTDTTTSGTQRGMVIQKAANVTDGTTEALLVLDNAETTANILTDYLLITKAATGPDTTTDAIDVSDDDLFNAINVGANAIAGTNFNVSGAGALVAVGVNSGTGLLQGTGGLTITGAAVSLNASSNFGVNIATGSSTGAIAIGGGTAGQTVAIDSSDWDITTTGAMTGIGAITSDGAISTTSTLNADGATTLAALTLDAGSNFAMSSGTGTFTQTNAQTTDATADAMTLTLSAGGTGSTGALRGLVISQSDTATTGVFDSLAYITNLKTPETTTNGLFIDQNAASGTLTNALHITNTAGTLTTAILVDGTAPGSFILDTGSLDISGAGAITGATGVSTTTVTATGLLQTTLITEQLRLRYDASNYLSTTVGSTGAVTFDATGAGAAFTISDALTASSTLTVSGASITASSASLAIGGALSGATTVTGSGNINTTGGALQTNSVTRIDNAGAGTLASLTLTTDLAVADGGTGASTFTDAGVLIGNTTGAIQVTSAGTSGQVLTSNGAGVDPTFQAAAGGLTVPTAFTAALSNGF